MEAIEELQTRLTHLFSWNKSRIDCFSKLIFAMLVTRTVNLTALASAFTGKPKILSHYRRIQRFICWLAPVQKKLKLPLQKLILSIINKEHCPLTLALDRTDWKFGKIHINLLVLGVLYHGVNLPICWISLGRAGNSKTAERIEIMQEFLRHFGKERIHVLTADREFVGKEWLQFLEKESIPFVIRIKKNTQVTRWTGVGTVPIESFFRNLRKKGKKVLDKKIKIGGVSVFIAGGKNKKGELLIVASNRFHQKSLKEYMKRWGIECLFKHLKKKGFQFEETHLTDKERISALFFILAIVVSWSMRVGIALRETSRTKVGTHGRKRTSFCRIGMDELRRFFLTPMKSFFDSGGYYKFFKTKNIPREIFQGVL